MTRLRLVSSLCITALVAWLAFVLFQLPGSVDAIHVLVQENLSLTDVENPVTAVLVNFRGYDTFLELVVLFLALAGVWALDMLPGYTEPNISVVLSQLTKTLLCVLLLVAVYLLWLGSYGPGGAFQAGALLGAAGVLSILSGYQIPFHNNIKLFLCFILTGLFGFVVIAVLSLLNGSPFMSYPASIAKQGMFFVEFCAMASIGATLTALFAASAPNPSQTL